MAENRMFVLPIVALALIAAAVDVDATAGKLCCTSTGNCPGQGIGGANVQLNCIVDGRVRTLSRTTTDSTGSFNINGGPSMDKQLCGVVVDLPLKAAGECSDLSVADEGTILLAHFQPAGDLTAFKKYKRV